MAEYIEREALRDALYDADAIIKGVRILNQFPTADVAPVRHGRWVDADEWMTDECSNCGARINIEEFDDCSYHPEDGNIRLNYCPNCGAKWTEEKTMPCDNYTTCVNNDEWKCVYEYDCEECSKDCKNYYQCDTCFYQQ